MQPYSPMIKVCFGKAILNTVDSQPRFHKFPQSDRRKVCKRTSIAFCYTHGLSCVCVTSLAFLAFATFSLPWTPAPWAIHQTKITILPKQQKGYPYLFSFFKPPTHQYRPKSWNQTIANLYGSQVWEPSLVCFTQHCHTGEFFYFIFLRWNFIRLELLLLFLPMLKGKFFFAFAIVVQITRRLSTKESIKCIRDESERAFNSKCVWSFWLMEVGISLLYAEVVNLAGDFRIKILLLLQLPLKNYKALLANAVLKAPSYRLESTYSWKSVACLFKIISPT